MPPIVTTGEIFINAIIRLSITFNQNNKRAMAAFIVYYSDFLSSDWSVFVCRSAMFAAGPDSV
jgi:hypothetical protein